MNAPRTSLVISVIIGAKRHLEITAGKHSTDSLQNRKHTGDITHNNKSVRTIRNSKPEWWGAPLAEEDN